LNIPFCNSVTTSGSKSSSAAQFTPSQIHQNREKNTTPQQTKTQLFHIDDHVMCKIVLHCDPITNH